MVTDALAYHQLGWCVIPMKIGTGKTPAVRWKRFQTTRPTPSLLKTWFAADGLQAKFRNGERLGLGVVFGSVSRGLGSRDFDDLESYHQWAREHPQLADAVPTVKTPRGRHVHFLTTPDDVAAFRRRIGKPNGKGAVNCGDGELRIGVGCYSVLPPSPHPSGFVYPWLISPFDKPLPRISLDVFAPPLPPIARNRETEDTEDTEAIEEGTKENNGDNQEFNSVDQSTLVEPASLIEFPDAIQRAIVETLPVEPGRRNEQVFELCRALRAIPGVADAQPDQLKPIVRKWHELASAVITTKYFADTWADFVHGWPRVKHPKGSEPMSLILAAAQSRDLPTIAQQYDHPQLQVLVALCCELQRATGDGPFYLAVRTVGRLFDIDPGTASRWLGLLRHDRILEEVEKGSQKTRRASRFRYLPNHP